MVVVWSHLEHKCPERRVAFHLGAGHRVGLQKSFGVELQHFFTVVVENDGGGVAVVDPLKQAVTEGLWVER